MIEYYQQLLQEEKDQLTSAIKVLQNQTFVLERKYEKRLGRYLTNPSYRVCERHFDFLYEYFQIADIELVENQQYGIIGIQSNTLQGEKLSKLTSIFLLLLKVLFDEKMSTSSTSVHVYVTLQEIFEKIQLFSLWGNKAISPTDLRKTLAVLRKYQLIDVMDVLEEVTYESRIIIYPTIHLLLQPDAVQAIIKQYQEEPSAEFIEENEIEHSETNNKLEEVEQAKTMEEESNE